MSDAVSIRNKWSCILYMIQSGMKKREIKKKNMARVFAWAVYAELPKGKEERLLIRRYFSCKTSSTGFRRFFALYFPSNYIAGQMIFSFFSNKSIAVQWPCQNPQLQRVVVIVIIAGESRVLSEVKNWGDSWRFFRSWLEKKPRNFSSWFIAFLFIVYRNS